jgi:hypothetical protein
MAAAPQMVGSAVQAYQPAQSYFGVPGMSGGAPAQQGGGSMPSFESMIASLGSGIAGSGSGNGSVSNGGMDAAAVQSMQNAPNSQLGNIQRGIGMASLANSAASRLGGGSSMLGAGLGAAGGFLSMYSGIKQGGVMGYGSAIAGGLRGASGIASLMGNGGLAGSLGAAAGYVAAPLAVYSAIKNWKSGSTGSDALQGAEAGAAVGSMIVPGIGTVVGAVIGGAVGAISSAFGGGKTSGEQTADRSMDAALNTANDQQRMQAIMGQSPAQNIQAINGFMNAHDTSAGHSETIQNVFGKNGVSNMFQQMMPQINSAIAKNPALGKLSPSQLYSQVVTPWLNSKGASIGTGSKDVKGNKEGGNLQDSIIASIGQWQSGSFTSKTPVGAKGQTINIPLYGG